MRIGLTCEENADLRERDGVFPLNTASASSHLRDRGYACNPAMLDVLVENGAVTLSKPDAWMQADVDIAAEHFEQCELLVPYAAMCQALACSYADFLRPLREASERASQKYGQHVPRSDQYFVMQRMPPRATADERGHLAGAAPSIISFTLCDDVRERLERGEEV